MDVMAKVAQATLQALGALQDDLIESVTIVHRDTASADPVTYGPFEVTIGRYSDHVVAMAAMAAADRPLVLRDDQRVLLPTHVVTWTPTIYTEVLREDETTWRVVPPITGGRGTPFYVLQIRKPPH